MCCFSVSDKQAMSFDSPRHGLESFGWGLQIKSLYSQSLLVHELKFPVKKIQFFMVTKFCTPPQAATPKMLFTNMSKLIRN